MKTDSEVTTIDLNRIELEARRLRAETFAHGLKSFWTWAKDVTHLTSGRTA